MQALYDYTSTAATAHLTGDKSIAAATPGALTELHVDGFDAEQIWLQLDMASAQLVRRAKRLLKKAGTDPSLLTPETEEDLTGQQAAPLVPYYWLTIECLCNAFCISYRLTTQACATQCTPAPTVTGDRAFAFFQ